MNQPVPPPNEPHGLLRDFELQLRVRYRETDAQGRVHHSNYLNYFEIARVEMLRASGFNYKTVEEAGIFLVVSKATCNYHRGAAYDDLLTIKVRVTTMKKVRIVHQYEIFVGDERVADGETVVAAVTKAGKVTRLPDWFKFREDQ